MKQDARTIAIEAARAQVLRQPVYLDTETTGLGIADQVIDICVLDADGTVLVDSLVKPTIKIPRDAMCIHGITDEMVKDAPTWLEIWPQVEAAMAGRRVAVYNAEFDIRMMKQSHRKYKLPWRLKDSDFFCIMKLYAQFYGAWDRTRGSYRWQKLELAGKQCKIALPNAHRAQADTLLARAILHYMAEQK
jgi:DNA polymerase-3 subunit epsilon